jgi:NADH-quinone oxidoreductase subunit D
MKQLEKETDPKILQALLASRNDYTIEDALENEMILNMGPQHPATHGVLRLLLRLDGERIIGCVP